ncbi:MAG TPA: hypothetical protein VIO58_09500 [Candidatus Methanoperedens sp.]
MDNWAKYVAAAAVAGAVMGAAYYYPAQTFIAFVMGWLFIIPAVFIVYMVYGMWVYSRDLRHRIIVKMKPTEAMRALVRKQVTLKREKEIFYKELDGGRSLHGFIA